MRVGSWATARTTTRADAHPRPARLISSLRAEHGILSAVCAAVRAPVCVCHAPNLGAVPSQRAET
eukprot:6873363-Prymnesium_polylepis.2